MTAPRCRGGKPHDWNVLGVEDSGEKVARCNRCKNLRYEDKGGQFRYENPNVKGGSMSCTSCGLDPATVGEVKACRRCQKAGIVIEGLEDGVSLAEAVAKNPSLGNRFVVPAVPGGAEKASVAAATAPSKPKAERKATKKAPAKKAKAKKRK